MNSGPKRYHYPVCYAQVATQHPLSRFQSSARGPVVSLPRSLRSLHVVQRALSSKNIMRFFRTVSFLEKGFRTPFYAVFPSSMLKSKSPFARRKNPLMKPPALKAGRSTHLTQGGEDVIRGPCMFAVNIFPNPFWIRFKRLSEENLLSRDSICREGFVNG
jgi:hypothetical protein